MRLHLYVRNIFAAGWDPRGINTNPELNSTCHHPDIDNVDHHRYPSLNITNVMMKAKIKVVQEHGVSIAEKDPNNPGSLVPDRFTNTKE